MERDESIDLLKGIGILSVVVGHALNTDVFPSPKCDTIRIFVYVYHLPIFFFCSGFLFKEQRSFMQMTKSLTKKYNKFIYACCFSLLLIPVWIFMETLETMQIREIVQRILRIFLFRPSGIFVSAMWFIPFLCISQFLYYTILLFIKAMSARLIIITLLGVTGIVLTQKGYLHYYNINIALTMLPILFLGTLAREYKLIRFIERKMISFILCMLTGLSIFILNNLTGDEIDLSKGQLYGGTAFYPIVIIGLIFCIALSQIVKLVSIRAMKVAYKWLGIMGKESLYIMAYHFIVFKFIDGVAYKIFAWGDVVNSRLWPIAHQNIRLIYIFCGITFPILIHKCIKEHKHI